jgi:hypothetical protein
MVLAEAGDATRAAGLPRLPKASVEKDWTNARCSSSARAVAARGSSTSCSVGGQSHRSITVAIATVRFTTGPRLAVTRERQLGSRQGSRQVTFGWVGARVAGAPEERSDDRASASRAWANHSPSSPQSV